MSLKYLLAAALALNERKLCNIALLFLIPNPALSVSTGTVASIS
jgi:hypothetical protein